MARPYSSVNLTPSALARLRQITLTASAQVGRRVPTSDVVTALVALGEQDVSALVALLESPSQEGTDA